MMKFVSGCVFFVFACAFLRAEELNFTFKTPENEVHLLAEGGFTAVVLDGGEFLESTPGSPHLPVKTHQILLPPGAVVTNFVIFEQNPVIFESILIAPAQLEGPPSLPAPDFVPPDGEIYGSRFPWPEKQGLLSDVQYMRGYAFVALQLHPLRYIGAEKRLVLHQEMRVKVQYRMDERALSSAMPTQPASATRAFDGLIRGRAVNPDVARAYESDRYFTGGRGPDVAYLLITSEACTNAFAALGAHRASPEGGNYSVEMITTSSIYTNTLFDGIDPQEEIRNCIRYYVQNHNTEYVSLGGSSGIVPDRNCYVSCSGYTSSDMPTDLYYSDLDGTWDADGDHVYGEAYQDATEMDMLPDVIVGRIVINNAQQASNYVAKLIDYETNLPAYNRQLGRKLFFGGKRLWSSYDNTHPSDLCYDGHPEFTNRTGKSYDDEIWVRRIYRDCVRPWFETDTFRVFCDTLTSWDSPGPSNVGGHPASGTNMVQHINEEGGYAYTWIMTHGAASYWAMESQSFGLSQVAALTNLTPIVCTFACDTGRFDTHDSLSEGYIRQPGGGALAYIGSSRYGWGVSSSYYGGKGSDFGNAYWECAFRDGYLISGDAFAQHKARMVTGASANGSTRWLMFGINLQGDPGVPMPGHIPSLACVGLSVDDTAGNGDGLPNPSERVTLAVSIENHGFAAANGVTLSVATTSAYAYISNGGTATVGTVTARCTQVFAAGPELELSPLCPTPQAIELTFDLADADSNAWSQTLSFTVYASTPLTGTVHDIHGAPIAEMLIEFNGPVSGCCTSAVDGNFACILGDGTYEVRTRREGFVGGSAQLTVPPATNLAFSLGSVLPEAAPAAITALVTKCTAATNTFELANLGSTQLVYELFSTEGALFDSDPIGPKYWWYDITDTGTRILEMTDDDSFSGAIDIGFPFPFYGQVYTTLYVSADGWVSFDEPTTALKYNSLLPYAYLSVSPFIAFFWDDLNFLKGGRAYYEVRNDDMFILSFEGVPLSSAPTASNTVQLILCRNGQMLCQYKTVSNATSVTVGFQDATKTRGYSAVYNTSRAALSNGTAIRLVHSCGADWLAADVTSGALASSNNLTVTTILDSDGLVTGTYASALALACNDSAGRALSIPVTMHVLGHTNNHAPVADAQELTIDEDQFDTMIWPPEGLAITLTASDADGDTLVWTITNYPTGGWYDGTPPNITYYPNADFFGTDTIEFVVNDYEVDSNTGVVSIVVRPTPDPPWVWLSSPPFSSLCATGVLVHFEASASDPDGDDNLDYVDFLANGLPVCSDPSDGDTVFSNSVALDAGLYTITALVMDRDGLSYTSSPAALTVYASVPSPWSNADVGAPSITGAAGAVSGNYYLFSADSAISVTEDRFHFVYQEISGEGAIQARLNALTCADIFTLGGVMLREDLTSTSRGVFIGFDGMDNIQYACRVTNGTIATLLSTNRDGNAWFRIERTNDHLQAAYSTNGLSWTPLGDPVTNVLSNTLYVGLAAAGAGNMCTAHFDNVSIAFSGNEAPGVAIHTPASTSLLLRVGDTLRLAGSATDDGLPDPPATLDIEWTALSGPGQPTWADAGSLTTTVQFAQVGAYEIALRANDGQHVAQTSIHVMVANLHDSLVAYWPFDETNGVTARDRSGCGRDATLSGGAWHETGMARGALSVTGGTDCAQFAGAPITQATISAWVYSDGTSGESYLLDMPAATVSIEHDTSQRLRFRALYSTDEGAWVTPDNSITNGQWNHLLVYYNFEWSWMTPEIYINGVWQQVTQTATPRSDPRDNTGVGYLANHRALTNALRGNVDELRLYSRQLSIEEINLIAQPPPVNLGPQVSVVVTGTALVGASYALCGFAEDDGAPSNTLALLWQQMAGTGDIAFGGVTSALTLVTCTNAGAFTLRLGADDGEIIAHADCVLHADYDRDGDGTFDGEDDDDDNDGIPDYWETMYSLNPLDGGDALLDSDGDKYDNLSEYIAGTDPTNALSLFEVNDCIPADTLGVRLEWEAATGRTYRIYHTPEPLSPWSNVYEASGRPGAMTYTNNGVAPRGHFRVHVFMPQ
ncbi:MAG: hypothetical protein EOM20_10770 [Spartobacteria bacterium]|nr:hypothetical protein [Spartobacteria bacterium]